MTIFCNICMICLELNWFIYDPSCMLHLSEYVWTPRSSVLDVFNNFLLIDPTDRSKISSDQKRLFFAVSPNPLSFFANTSFKDRLLSFMADRSDLFVLDSIFHISVSLHLQILLDQIVNCWNIKGLHHQVAKI